MTGHVVQATAHNNTIVGVYDDHVELKSGWQSQNVEAVGLRDVAIVGIRGIVNVTLTLQTNTGRVFELNRMALPDARRIKAAIELRKRRAGLYD